ncbi:MAG: PD40 domain-containing protein [Actinobacteria bacterium]|nr:PD40 domain-containing protein [Actinomycetota bacterium]
MTSDPQWPLGLPRALAPGQRTQVLVADVATGSAHVVHTEESLLLEAPNWAPDADALLLNGGGHLWRLGLDGAGSLDRIRFEGLPPINNDHVVDAARGLVYLSANDGHIYSGPLAGGRVRRVTHDNTRYHFLHGVSPDGGTLAFVELPVGDFSAAGRLALVAAGGGATRYPAAGEGHLDGPEYSPDGAWLYVNTEHFGRRAGHAQLARIPAAGGRPEHLVPSETVDWFPHLSPDGRHATYVAFPPGTLGHPADLQVEVRLVATTDWSRVLARFAVFGGQGTLNVNSWSPDGRQFAFVAYPMPDAVDAGPSAP